MTNNTDNSTSGFFGVPNMRIQALRSIGAYLRIGIIIQLALLAVIVIPLEYMWENRNKRLFRNPTFWGGLLGYGVGVTLNVAMLGNVKSNEIVYKYDNGVELGDPEVATEYPVAGAMIIAFTTFTGVAAAKLGDCVYNTCKSSLPILYTFRPSNVVRNHSRIDDEESTPIRTENVTTRPYPA